MKKGFKGMSFVISIGILLCLCHVSCHNEGGDGEFDQFFTKEELPAITLEDAMKIEWLDLWGYVVDEDNEIERTLIEVRVLPDQKDPEKGVRVRMRMPGTLFSDKYSPGKNNEETEDSDIPQILGVGYYKDNKLKIYVSEIYSGGRCRRFDEESLLMLDIAMDDFSQMYGELNYPLTEQGDSIIKLSFSLYESETGRKLRDCTPETVYTNRKYGEIRLSLYDYPLGNGNNLVEIMGEWDPEPSKPNKRTAYEEIQELERFDGILDEKHELKLDEYTIRLTPKRLYITETSQSRQMINNPNNKEVVFKKTKQGPRRERPELTFEDKARLMMDAY